MSKTPKYSFTMLANKRAKIELYDQLGPRWAGMIDARMIAQSLRDAGPVESIELRINSPGGSAFEGLAIANILKDHPAQVDVVVDGVAGSAATLPMMAGDTRRVPKNALVFIHEAMTYASGNKAQLLKLIAALDAVNKAGIALYASKTKKTEAELATMMRDETWMTGDEALAAGFATTTGDDLPADKVPVKQQFSSPQLSIDAELLPEIAALLQSVPTLEPTMATTPSPAAPASPAPTAPAAPATPAAPAVNQTADPATPAAPAVPATPAAPVLEAKPITMADLQQVAQQAAQQAVTGERNRSNDVVAMCAKAGCPEKAAEFISAGKSTEEIRQTLFDVMCERNQAVGDGISPQQLTPDADTKFKKEYAASKADYVKQGISETDYIAMRRVDEGIEQLSPAPTQAAKA